MDKTPRDIADSIFDHCHEKAQLEQTLQILQGEMKRVLEMISNMSNLGSDGAYVFSQGKYIIELSVDAAEMYKRQRILATRILLRSMLESVANLRASIKRDSFPFTKILCEMKNDCERCRQLIELIPLAQRRPESEAHLRQMEKEAVLFQSQYLLTGEQRWPVRDVFLLADLGEFLTLQYAYLCQDTHANIPAIFGAALVPQHSNDESLKMLIILLAIAASGLVEFFNIKGVDVPRSSSILKLLEQGILQ